jgi:hypothetical protein
MNHYKTNEMLVKDNYTLTELGDMMPWEREVYIIMITQHKEEEAKRWQQ